MSLTKRRLIEQQIEQQQRWADAGVQADPSVLDALDQLQAGVEFEQKIQHDAARSSSKKARQAQAATDADRVAAFFAAAYRPGMGRIQLQAAAIGVLRDQEQREKDRLAAMQQVDNRSGARQASAALAALQKQTALVTLHRAGKWLKDHHPPPINERQ